MGKTRKLFFSEFFKFKKIENIKQMLDFEPKQKFGDGDWPGATLVLKELGIPGLFSLDGLYQKYHESIFLICMDNGSIAEVGRNADGNWILFDNWMDQ